MDEQILIYTATVILPDKMKIPSVNKYKEPRRTKWGVYMYKPDHVRNYQNELVRQLSSSDLIKLRGLEAPVLKVKFTFQFKNRYWRRDCSNMIKSSEDAVVKVIGIDDGRTIHISGEKIKRDDKKEVISISIEVVNES